LEPKLDKLGKNLVIEELVDKVHNSTNHRRSVVEVATAITTDMIEQHLLQLVKLHTTIQAFMETLLKDMSTLKDSIAMHKRTLEDSIAMHNATLEELSYHRIISSYDHLEVWTTYLKGKSS
jgi:hypothetical protein